MSKQVSTRVFSRKMVRPVEEPALEASHAVPSYSSSTGEKHGDYEIVHPPLNPEQLLQEHANSSALPQNIDAYKNNIHGYGFQLDPHFDFNAADVRDRVSDSIWLDNEGMWGDLASPPPTEADVTRKIAELETRTRREILRANTFFRRVSSTKSWVELSSQMRQDLEICGYAFLELRRDAQNRIAGFSHTQPQHIVALKSNKLIDVNVPVLRSRLSWDTRIEQRFGHLWGQVKTGHMDTGQVSLVFKPWLDPRIISSKTGNTYTSTKELERKEPGVRPATELVQFKIDNSLSAFFGYPRWFGNIRSVQGSRKAESINLLYFDSKGVPPLAILVSGGSLTKSATEQIEGFIEDELVGAENFHKILIIEAEPAGSSMDPLNSGKVRIELVPLTAAQHDDGLFMKYIAKCRDMIGESMRNPRIVRGDIDGINRATATAALAFAESQIYAPLRNDWDWWVNNCVMYELGCSVIEYRTQSPVATDIDLAMAVAELTKANVLVPNDGRKFAERAFNRPVETIAEPWTRQPMPLTLAQQLTSGTGDAERQTVGAVGAAQSQASTKMIDSLAAESLEEITLRLPGPISRYFTPNRSEE